MPARLSAKEARQLGLFESEAERKRATGPRRKPFPYRTRCHACGEEFVSEAAEERHSEATGHRRYELVLSCG